MLFDFGERFVVLIGRCQHADVVPVLGRGTQHGRAADIDVLDGLFQRAIGFGDGRFEGIEIQHQQVDRRDAQLGHDCVIGAAAAEQAAMDLRVQGLDAAVHDFGKAGDAR